MLFYLRITQKNNSISKLTVDDEQIETPEDIANTFNNYFVDVGISISAKVSSSSSPPRTFSSYLSTPVLQSIYLEPPQPFDIFKIINSLKTNKACGYDNISAFFCRLGNNVLSPFLSVYFRSAFEVGVFPQIFKTAKVIPIHKKGPKDTLSNYRPISLLPILSKVFEKLIKNNFMDFFNKHRIFFKNQYGFRENHNVVHALLDVSTNCYDAIQNKLFTAILLMDLTKAFDTVSHEILLKKLNHYGIRGIAFDLIKSYLANRQQFVCVNGSNSQLNFVAVGVPQGSILGPLLFLIYVNDLHRALSFTPRLFADDTCMLLENASPQMLEEICNDELSSLKHWCDANKLQINPNKSVAMIIPPKLNHP